MLLNIPKIFIKEQILMRIKNVFMVQNKICPRQVKKIIINNKLFKFIFKNITKLLENLEKEKLIQKN